MRWVVRRDLERARDAGEARLRERFGPIAWHAFGNDLVVDDPRRRVRGPAAAEPHGGVTGIQASSTWVTFTSLFSRGTSTVPIPRATCDQRTSIAVISFSSSPCSSMS